MTEEGGVLRSLFIAFFVQFSQIFATGKYKLKQELLLDTIPVDFLLPFQFFPLSFYYF
jgi:hypothetical protein